MNFEAFYKLSYGLYLVSTGNKNEKSAYIANTAFQVTAEPSQLAISCHKDNFSAGLIDKSGVFSVSVLAQDAKSEIIRNFGYETSSKLDKFATNVDYKYGQTGVPVVTSESIAWFECKVSQQIDVGSHIVFIGEVVDNELLKPDADPLTYAYYRNVKRGLAPKNAPTYIDKSKIENKKDAEPESAPELEGARCLVCGYLYDPKVGDPDGGIPPGTAFEDIPDDWMCPACGATKDMFEVIE